MEHLDYCKEHMEKAANLQDEWAKKWPNHCKECYGWGGMYSTYDPSPSGVSLGAGFMTDFDPCFECMKYEICPRCGENTLLIPYDESEGDFDYCESCGWSAEDPDGMPPNPECTCWDDPEHPDNKIETILDEKGEVKMSDEKRFIIKKYPEMVEEAKAILQEMQSFIPQILEEDKELTPDEWYAYTDRYHLITNELDVWFVRLLDHINTSSNQNVKESADDE